MTIDAYRGKKLEEIAQSRKFMAWFNLIKTECLFEIPSLVNFDGFPSLVEYVIRVNVNFGPCKVEFT